MITILVLALAAAAPAQCPHVDVALAEAKMPAAFRGRPFRETSATFAKAYAKACAEGLLKSKPLAIKNRLVLINAPEANVASIYADKGRTLLGFPFVAGGKAHAPSAQELHEAIYCAVHGASAKEQEESGRCLPD